MIGELAAWFSETAQLLWLCGAFGARSWCHFLDTKLHFSRAILLFALLLCRKAVTLSGILLLAASLNNIVGKGCSSLLTNTEMYQAAHFSKSFVEFIDYVIAESKGLRTFPQC